MRHARELAGPGVEIGLVAWKEQNLLMADGPVRDFGFVNPWDKQLLEAMQWQAENPVQRPIFILDDAMGRCIDRDSVSLIAQAQRLPLNRLNWCVGPGDDPSRTPMVQGPVRYDDYRNPMAARQR